MDIAFFDDLGERVRIAYQRTNYDEASLPAIADDLLSRADLPEFDFRALGEFLRSTPVHQHGNTAFSDLAVTLYRQPEFYIELLMWNAKSTAIHQHEFSGCFTVLSGSSVEAEYRFTEHRRINTSLSVGSTTLDSIQLLKPGMVRRIHAGTAGAFHSIFHIDQPSVTLVIRNPIVPTASPQLSLARPSFAFAAQPLSTDAKTRTLGAWLDAMRAASDPRSGELALDLVRSLDFARIFELRRHLLAAMPRSALLDAVRERHGDLAELLGEVMRVEQIERRLLEARQIVRDPELRMFLALMLFAPARVDVYRLIERTYPGEQPEDRCADWLARLGAPDIMLDALIRILDGGESAQRRDSLTETLSKAMPRDRAAAVDLARGTIRGEVPSNEYADAYATLRTLEELAPLFA